MKINILFIIDFFYGRSGGGTETHLSHLVRHLNKNKFNCYIVAFDTEDTPFIKNLKEQGAVIYCIPVKRYYTINALRKAYVLSQLIKTLQIDIVQTFHFKSDTYGALISRVSGVKWIISSKRDIGDTKTKWQFFLNRSLQRLFNGYIVVADRIAAVIKEKENVPCWKIRRIYNGVDINRFIPPTDSEKQKERSNLGLSTDDFIVGMVAVFRPEKNHNIFFKAIENASKKIKSLKAVIVGDGPLFSHYKRYCQQGELIDRVIFTGSTNNVIKYLKTFDLACLVPGKNEGFSNSILEKMAMGLPLIVTDVGGNTEAVIHNFNGIVIPSNDYQSLADAIVSLYYDYAKRIEMGIRSRKRVESHFSLELMIKNHEQYYERLFSSPGF